MLLALAQEYGELLQFLSYKIYATTETNVHSTCYLQHRIKCANKSSNINSCHEPWSGTPLLQYLKLCTAEGLDRGLYGASFLNVRGKTKAKPSASPIYYQWKEPEKELASTLTHTTKSRGSTRGRRLGLWNVLLANKRCLVRSAIFELPGMRFCLSDAFIKLVLSMVVILMFDHRCFRWRWPYPFLRWSVHQKTKSPTSDSLGLWKNICDIGLLSTGGQWFPPLILSLGSAILDSVMGTFGGYRRPCDNLATPS